MVLLELIQPKNVDPDDITADVIQKMRSIPGGIRAFAMVAVLKDGSVGTVYNYGSNYYTLIGGLRAVEDRLLTLTRGLPCADWPS